MLAAGPVRAMSEQGGLPWGWGWDEAALRAAAHQVADLAVDHLAGLPNRPVFTPVPAELADRWRGWQWPDQEMPLPPALAAARQARAPFDARVEGLAGNPPLTVYAGREAHSCLTKAVEMLGIGRRNLRLLDSLDQRLDARMLDHELAAARRRAEHPIAVVASAGTASTGVIDPLDEIADVCARHGVWFHIDGSYGAPAVLTDRYRARLAGLRRADSIAIDPHKWLYVPVDSGALLVRHPQQLRDAFSLVPTYLRTDSDPAGMTDAPWLSEYGPEQTRPLRALRLWAALAATGRDGYRWLIDHDLDLAELLATRIRDHPALSLDATGLSIVCFRYRTARSADQVQAEIARRIQLGGESFVTTTELGGHTVLRACFLNPLTTPEHVDALVDLVAATGAAVTAQARRVALRAFPGAP
jgi:glutamate/tyrosine decarboxylase-like PLP-dependent enzyme